MKSCRLLLMCLFVCTTCFAEPPKTKEDFLVAVRAAYEAKDIKRIHELTWEKGVSEWDRKMTDQMMPLMLKSIDKIEKLAYAPIPADFMETRVAFGKRTESTHPIVGVLELSFKTEGDNATSQTMLLPYAVIDGSYYIVTGKTTDLDWNGPKDKQLGVTVWGTGWEKAKIHIKYNASGVDVEKDQTAMSSLFVGQYIEDVTVTSDQDDAEVTLRLREEGNSEPFYISTPLKGKGQIHYKKGDVGVPSK